MPKPLARLDIGPCAKVEQDTSTGSEALGLDARPSKTQKCALYDSLFRQKNWRAVAVAAIYWRELNKVKLRDRRRSQAVVAKRQLWGKPY
jgi:hypothetical protein